MVVAVIFCVLEEVEREEVGKRKKKARILRKPTGDPTLCVDATVSRACSPRASEPNGVSIHQGQGLNVE